MIHELKEHPKHFQDVLEGKKTFEVRRHDRDFQVGDLLALNEIDPYSGKYTGRCCLVYVDYILSDLDYCKTGYSILAIKPCTVFKQGVPISNECHEKSNEVPLIDWKKPADKETRERR